MGWWAGGWVGGLGECEGVEHVVPPQAKWGCRAWMFTVVEEFTHSFAAIRSEAIQTCTFVSVNRKSIPPPPSDLQQTCGNSHCYMKY